MRTIRKEDVKHGKEQRRNEISHIKGITEEILRKALTQAHSARQKIMKVVTDCIPPYRT